MAMSQHLVATGEPAGPQLHRQVPWTPATETPRAYAGAYVGNDVEVTLHVTADDDGVRLAGRGLARTPATPTAVGAVASGDSTESTNVSSSATAKSAPGRSACTRSLHSTRTFFRSSWDVGGASVGRRTATGMNGLPARVSSREPSRSAMENQQ